MGMKTEGEFGIGCHPAVLTPSRTVFHLIFSCLSAQNTSEFLFFLTIRFFPVFSINLSTTIFRACRAEGVKLISSPLNFQGEISLGKDCYSHGSTSVASCRQVKFSFSLSFFTSTMAWLKLCSMQRECLPQSCRVLFPDHSFKSNQWVFALVWGFCFAHFIKIHLSVFAKYHNTLDNAVFGSVWAEARCLVIAFLCM